MNEPLNNTDTFRESLPSDYDKSWYDRFINCNQRKPKTMWELMCWCADAQKQPSSTFCEDLLGFKL